MNNQIPQQGNQTISEAKIAEIKAVINAKWDTATSKESLTIEVQEDYIFGVGNKDFVFEDDILTSTNEHYTREFIRSLVDEIDLEKNPLPIIEPIEPTELGE